MSRSHPSEPATILGFGAAIQIRELKTVLQRHFSWFSNHVEVFVKRNHVADAKSADILINIERKINTRDKQNDEREINTRKMKTDERNKYLSAMMKNK